MQTPFINQLSVLHYTGIPAKTLRYSTTNASRLHQTWYTVILVQFQYSSNTSQLLAQQSDQNETEFLQAEVTEPASHLSL